MYSQKTFLAGLFNSVLLVGVKCKSSTQSILNCDILSLANLKTQNDQKLATFPTQFSRRGRVGVH